MNVRTQPVKDESDEPLDFIGVAITCRHCQGTGKDRFIGDCGWCDGTGQQVVARLWSVAAKDMRPEPERRR